MTTTEKKIKNLLKYVEKERAKAWRLQQIAEDRNIESTQWEMFGKRIAFAKMEYKLKKLLE